MWIFDTLKGMINTWSVGQNCAPEVEKMIDNTSGNVVEVLNSRDLLDSFCLINKKSLCDSFLNCNENWEIIINPIFFDFWNTITDDNQFQTFKTKLNEFISYVFDKWYVFKSPNLKLIDLILYWTREEVLSYLALDTNNKVLASNTKIIDETWKINQKIIFELYKSIKITEPNLDWLWCIEFAEFDIKQFRFRFWEKWSLHINIDEFFYWFWNQDPDWKEISIIRYWLSEIYWEIEKVLWENWNRETLNWVKIPYKIKNPKNAINDSLNELVNLSEKKKPIIDKLWRVDLKQLETIFPEVKEWEIFLEYVSWSNWYYGIWLNWLPIKDNIQIEALKINISNIIRSWMEFFDKIEENWIIKYIANDDFFVFKKWDLKNRWFLDFSKSIIIRKDIDKESWNIFLSNPNVTVLKCNIANEYWIRCNSIQYEWWNIYGFMMCKSYILIKNATISWASFKTYSWNITVGEEKNNRQLISWSEIIAPWWKVTIYWNVEHTTIIADEVEIIWKATVSKIVAKKIKIKEVWQNSNIVAWNIEVWKNNWSNSKFTLVVTNALNWRENQLTFLTSRLEKASGKEQNDIKNSIETLQKMEEMLFSIYWKSNSSIFSINNPNTDENDVTTYRMISHTFWSSKKFEENLADLKFLLEVSSIDSVDHINIWSLINNNKTSITLDEATKLLQNHYSKAWVESRRSDLRRKLITKHIIPVNINNFKGKLFEISERWCQIEIWEEIIGLNKWDVIDVSFSYTNWKISEKIDSPLLIVRAEKWRLVWLFLLVSVENKISRIISSLDTFDKRL